MTNRTVNNGQVLLTNGIDTAEVSESTPEPKDVAGTEAGDLAIVTFIVSVVLLAVALTLAVCGQSIREENYRGQVHSGK